MNGRIAKLPLWWPSTLNYVNQWNKNNWSAAICVSDFPSQDALSKARGVSALTFTAVAGKSYTILRRNNLSADSWAKWINIPGQPSTHQVTVTDSDITAQRFYRLVTPAVP